MLASPEARVAAYYAPAPDDPLFAAGATWLGRDPESGAPTPQPDLPDIETLTAEPRVYGFHATLKPPMRLAGGRAWSDLVAACRALADRTAPFALPRLLVADVHGFLALREAEPCPPLQALADEAVADLDPFRAPLTRAELDRRRRHGLSAAEDGQLRRWGYPYVFGTWFFHMTLTRRLASGEKAVWTRHAQTHFANALRAPRMVSDFCLFTQAAPGAPFQVAGRLPLRG